YFGEESQKKCALEWPISCSDGALYVVANWGTLALKDNSQLLSIFCEAREHVSSEERAAYLDQACGGDRHLKARVEALLHAEQEVGDFLEGYAEPHKLTVTDNATVTESPGTVIGPYKLLEQIGEGGFGVVFVAEQTQPVRRKVALKILKPGMDTRQ